MLPSHLSGGWGKEFFCLSPVLAHLAELYAIHQALFWCGITVDRGMLLFVLSSDYTHLFSVSLGILSPPETNNWSTNLLCQC